mmetsp:Transcript_24246/g.75448  ORF Transcript_24246/g.75448 Transcript_24246/m.75448 type:complete len:437 (+) Transcript_24246:90-1400(+)
MSAPQASNSKSDLVNFFQRFINRTLTKDDITYTTIPNGDRFQVTVKLNCHQGHEFAGEVCGSEKEAQQSAAAQALLAFSAEIAALPPKTKKGKTPQPPGTAGCSDPVPQALAALGLTNNFKSELVQKMQAHIKRAVTKTCIVYTVAQVGEQFQATVRLDCTGGQEFTGEVSMTDRLAEHAAAQQALIYEQMWLPATAPPPTAAAPAATRAMVVAGGAAGVKRKATAAANSNGDSPKCALVTFLQRLIKRTMVKGDVTYEVAQTVGGYQATVTTGCFEGRQFAGEVSPDQKTAEAAAARQAHIALQAEFGQLPQVKKPRTNSGQGGGMGGGLNGGLNGGVNGGMGGSMGGGKSGGGANLARQILEMNTGTVQEWNEAAGFGWIRADAPVNHPAASKRQGKIYVHKRDAMGIVGTGSTVQFKVYSDSQGLGACEVTPM